MSRIVEHNETFTGIPTSYDADNSTVISPSNTQNGLNPHTNSSSGKYANFNGTYNTTLYAFYDFTVDTLPSNSVVNSVSCQAKAFVSSAGANRGYSYLQLCANISVKGEQYQITGTTTAGQVVTLSGATWSLSETNNIKLRITVNRTAKNQNYYCRFYGATLTVNYTWYETFYSISTLSNVQGVSISSTSGETLEGDSNAITLSNVSDIDSIIVLDNGNDITSLFTRSGSNYVYTLTNINADHAIVVEDNSQQQRPMFVNDTGVMKLVSSVLHKVNNVWQDINYTDFWRKVNGNYVNDTSISGRTTLVHNK